MVKFVVDPELPVPEIFKKEFETVGSVVVAQQTPRSEIGVPFGSL
jgi:hypothetical protein